MMQPASMADLPAFCVGHAEDAEAATGCTVIVAPAGATCAVDVRGGGPATRETDLLKPENMIEAVHAVVLSGGSAFGLESSCGVMDALAARRIGFELGPACVPIVVGACIFDLLIGSPVHPGKDMGALAAQRALAAWDARSDGGGAAAPPDTPMGNVGVGCGATVGKLGKPGQAMKSGYGHACLRMGNVTAAALVAVNALGCVRDARGRWIAGCLGEDGTVMDPYAAMAQGPLAGGASHGEGAAGAGIPCQNTTLGVVLTNAQLTKAQAQKVSSATHDAYARRIEPVHTQNDGDAIFTFASGEAGSQPVDTVAILATKAMERAIENAVMHARGTCGLKAARDL
jgi:L-aminopeptidase/D-esterase-like protein